MPSWIGQAWRRGILTTRYPREPATPEELPETGRAPLLVGPKASGDLCPTGAIDEKGVDQGKCIRCARCLRAGYAFSGPVHWVAARPSELLGTGSTASPEPRSLPLARLGPSLHVYLADVGSCNACNREALAIQNPYYDAARLGISFVASPHHADVLLVVGIPTAPMLDPVRRAYEAMPGPKAVVALGACALGGGVFQGNPGTAAPLAERLPVDRFVPGCPPSPLDVLASLLSLRGRRERRGP